MYYSDQKLKEKLGVVKVSKQIIIKEEKPKFEWKINSFKIKKKTIKNENIIKK